MHSQAKLIQHLNAVRSFLVSRHAEVQSGDELSEGCICYGSEHAAPDGEHDPLHTAVKQLVMAEFDKLGKAYGGNVYMYPVRIGTYESDSNYHGTADAVHQGYCDRIALIDRWIADAHKKLMAAVFRKAIDSMKGGSDTFMCCAIRHAVSLLMDVGHSDAFKHPMVVECQAVLNRFAPQDKQFAWFPVTPQHTALRIAILNLCITEVTRGFK